MNEVFADSSYWLALLNPDDALHSRASASRRPHRDDRGDPNRGDGPIQPAALPSGASDFWRETPENPEVTIVPLVPDLLERAADLFQQRPDKSWSFTDCLSFVVMTQRNVSEALTYDHHYEQAGFRAMMRDIQ